MLIFYLLLALLPSSSLGFYYPANGTSISGSEESEPSHTHHHSDGTRTHHGSHGTGGPSRPHGSAIETDTGSCKRTGCNAQGLYRIYEWGGPPVTKVVATAYVAIWHNSTVTNIVSKTEEETDEISARTIYRTGGTIKIGGTTLTYPTSYLEFTGGLTVEHATPLPTGTASQCAATTSRIHTPSDYYFPIPSNADLAFLKGNSSHPIPTSILQTYGVTDSDCMFEPVTHSLEFFLALVNVPVSALTDTTTVYPSAISQPAEVNQAQQSATGLLPPPPLPTDEDPTNTRSDNQGISPPYQPPQTQGRPPVAQPQGQGQQKGAGQGPPPTPETNLPVDHLVPPDAPGNAGSPPPGNAGSPPHGSPPVVGFFPPIFPPSGGRAAPGGSPGPSPGGTPGGAPGGAPPGAPAPAAQPPVVGFFPPVLPTPAAGGGSAPAPAPGQAAPAAGPAVTPPPQLSVGGNTFTADSSGNFNVGGQTLTPGGVVTAPGGAVVSLDQGGSHAVVDGTTQVLSPASGAGSGFSPVLNFGGTAVTANSASALVIGSQTLSPGGPPITVDGHTLSLLGPVPSAVVVDGKTQPLVPVPIPTAGSGASGPGSVLTFGGQTYTANSAGAFVIGSQTLTPGGPALTVDGTTLSLQATPPAAVIDGSTQLLGTAGPSGAPAVITFDGSTYTADKSGDFVLSGHTVVPGGPPVTLGTEVVSLAPGGSVVVVDGTTMTLAGAGALSSAGAGAGTGPSVSLATQTPGSNGAHEGARAKIVAVMAAAFGAAAAILA